MPIKINDIVQISIESKWCGNGDCNPVDTNGVVLKIEPGDLGIYVKWNNGDVNSYDESDLILIEQNAQECDATYVK